MKRIEAEYFVRRFNQGLNHRLARFRRGGFAHYSRPTSIALLLTKNCNARCMHCNLWENIPEAGSLCLERWRSLLKDLRNWLGPVHVVITGGEALLRPFTPDLLEYGVSCGLFVELLTNGYRNDRELLERIALSNPGRITISLDGTGNTHDQIRGHRDFWFRTNGTIETLCRLRRDFHLRYDILLKCVIMRQNLDEVAEVARYARRHGAAVLYQPIEQNYGTEDDPRWFESAPTWPVDSQNSVRAVEELKMLKSEGYPILNSLEHLEFVIRYFKNPVSSQEIVRAHTSINKSPLCAAINTLQIEPNGDVTICSRRLPVGNIKEEPIREIWRNRPRWWQGEGCGIDAFCPSDPRLK